MMWAERAVLSLLTGICQLIAKKRISWITLTRSSAIPRKNDYGAFKYIWLVIYLLLLSLFLFFFWYYWKYKLHEKNFRIINTRKTKYINFGHNWPVTIDQDPQEYSSIFHSTSSTALNNFLKENQKNIKKQFHRTKIIASRLKEGFEAIISWACLIRWKEIAHKKR